MSKLDVVVATNKELVKSQPITAVFAGGTSGIGEYASRVLASTHGSSGQGLRVYISVCPAGEFYFVHSTDLSLLREVDRVCVKIIQSEEAHSKNHPACIDLLVMTQAHFAFGSKLARKETSEGLDASLSLLYYSRMRFVTQLLPLLVASNLPGRVVSVFGPGRDDTLLLDDLSLRNPDNFGFGTLGSHAAYMTTFFFERMAVAHAGKLALSHYFPKIVITPAYKGAGVPAWFKGLYVFVGPLLRAMSLSQHECGQRVLFHASNRFPARGQVSKSAVNVALSSDGVCGGGAYRTNWDGEIIPLTKGYQRIRKDEVSQKVWDHTMKVFDVISSGGRL